MTQTIELGSKTMTQSVVDAFDPQVFSDMVIREARQANFMRNLAAEVNTALVGSPGSALEYRNISALSANDKSEGSATSNQDLSYSNDTVATDIKKQVVVEITQEATDDSNVDDLEEIATEIGQAHADAFAQEMYDLVADTGLSNAATYNVSTTDEIDYNDVTNAAFEKLGENKRTGDALVVHPTVYASMLRDDKLTDADRVGTDRFVREGQEMEEMKMHVAGVDVWVSTVANKPTGTSGDIVGVMLDTDHAFVAVLKNRPNVRQDDLVAERKIELSSFERYGKAVINEDAICLLQNA
jgi:hypothetical protein